MLLQQHKSVSFKCQIKSLVSEAKQAHPVTTQPSLITPVLDNYAHAMIVMISAVKMVH